MTISSYNQIYSCVFPGRLGKGGFEVQGQMSGKEKGHGRSRDWREWEESQAGTPKCAKTSTWAAVYRHQSTHLHTDLLKHPQRPAHRTYRAMNTSLQTDTQRNILAKAKVFISNLKTMYSQTKMELWLEWQIVPSFHFVFTRHQVPAILCWLIALGVQLSFPSVSNNHAFILYLKLYF